VLADRVLAKRTSGLCRAMFSLKKEILLLLESCVTSGLLTGRCQDKDCRGAIKVARSCFYNH